MTAAAITDATKVPTVQRRVAVAALVALAAAVYVFWFDRLTNQTGLGGSDFDQLWYGARVLWHGGNPYDEIGPGRAFDWGWPLVYPLPTIVALMPFAILPVLAARIAFASLSAGLLAFALSRRGFGALAVLVSAAVVDGVRAGQLSVAMTGAVLVSSVAFILILKPPFGLVLLAANPHRRAFVVATVVGVALTAAAFLVRPHWLESWMQSLATVSHLRVPLVTWGGPLLLGALLRWRRLDARVLLACACVPHTPVVYDVVPLGLLARNLREGVGFAVLTYIALLAQDSLVKGLAPGDAATIAARILNLTVYLPGLLVVLSRPNVSVDV